jgi:hypothetical protein
MVYMPCLTNLVRAVTAQCGHVFYVCYRAGCRTFRDSACKRQLFDTVALSVYNYNVLALDILTERNSI